MSANNLILYLPFDEKNGLFKTPLKRSFKDRSGDCSRIAQEVVQGSKLAYDYSQSRADAVLHSSSFSAGRRGNAIEFRQGSYAEVTKPTLEDLNSPFSIAFYISPIYIETGDTNKFTWLLNLSNNDSIEYEVQFPIEVWTHLMLTHQNGEFIFFVDGEETYRMTTDSQLLGLSLNQNYYGGDYACCRLDDFRVYNKVLTYIEIQQDMEGQSKNTYTIDGVDFKEYGVYVSDSDGILNRPKLKTLASISWDNYHGEDVDLKHKYYEARDITLSCFIKARDKMDFLTKVTAFEQLFDARGLHRLVIDVHPTKPLIYEVYCKDEISLSKKWNEGGMVGTFKLKLVEPQPVKKVLKHIRVLDNTKTCSITLSTNKFVNIFWGDGSIDEDVSGLDITISHDYAEAGEYYPVITGCIDEIEAFQTNAIIVWDKL